jgi:DNA-binding MarR family transcriptional regulator
MAATTATTTPSAHALSERELHAWRGLLRVHASVTQALGAELEAAHGLSLSAYEVLMFLADAAERRMRMRDLADSVILSRSGLTRLVDRLEADGLIGRESCPSDARGAYAKLTEKGAAKLAEARATHLAGVREHFLDRLAAEDQVALAEAWERVIPAAHAPGPACGG